MAEKEKDTAPAEPGEEHATQSDEERKAVLQKAQKGATATGQAAAQELSDDPPEIPSGDERGNTNHEIVGDPKPDFGKAAKSKPSGLQAKPATYTVNGTIKPGLVPTPGGPMPRAALLGTPSQVRKVEESARRALEPSGTRSDQTLSDEQIDSMSAAELRAVGSDRGYAIPPGGSRRVRAAFKAAQADAESED